MEDHSRYYSSLQARRELGTIRPECLSKPLSIFHDNGGYAQFYGNISPVENGLFRNPSSSPGYSHLHWLATYGSPAETIRFLESHDSHSINELTANGETAVYLACARGVWKVVKALLDHGADCTIPCTSFRITCLHWAFAFHDDEQAELITRLVAAGANLNAMVADITPFPHHPFVLPPGTALHWVTVVEASKSLDALIKEGIDILARDGSDQYVFDDRVRILDKFGGPNIEAYSIPQVTVKGLTAMDYAAMIRDPFIFELFVQYNMIVDVNVVDEEGWSVLHRLSTDMKQRTRPGNAFSDAVFRGTPSENREKLKRTVMAIKALGGDLELLTTPTLLYTQSGQLSALQIAQRTPLMMAALGACPDVVEALLEAGANVDTENNKGTTALMCISENQEVAPEIIRTLVSHGANVNHCNKAGATAVLAVSYIPLLDSLDLLLSKGADIETRAPISDVPSSSEGRNIFGNLPKSDKAFNETEDLKINMLLQKYVFSCPDKVKKRRIIDRGDIDGCTLLHHYSMCSMPHCVQALLLNGAPANALRYKYKHERQPDGSSDKVSWFETPLDVAFQIREEKLIEMQGDSRHTLPENEDILQRMNVTISILEQAGGVRKGTEVRHEKFVFDEERYGKRGFIKALREFGTDVSLGFQD